MTDEMSRDYRFVLEPCRKAELELYLPGLGLGKLEWRACLFAAAFRFSLAGIGGGAAVPLMSC